MTRILAWPAFANRKHNPYQSLLYTEMVKIGHRVDEFNPRSALVNSYDVLHLHWPEAHLGESLPAAVLKGRVLISLLKRARRRGTKIVWTAHNLHSHEKRFPWLEARFWAAFIPLIDGVVALSDKSLSEARDAFPRLNSVPGFVVPHGHYRDAYPNEISRAEARRKLSVPADVTMFLFLGKVRRYKGVTELLTFFTRVPGRDLVLFVAGLSTDSELKREIEVLAASDGRVHLYLEMIPDEELQLYLRAADCMVLPYREALNSGTALLALSFDLPVLGAASGPIDDLRAAYGDRWVRTFVPPLTATDLELIVRWSKEDGERTSVPLQDREWAAIAQQTADAYEEIRHPRS